MSEISGPSWIRTKDQGIELRASKAIGPPSLAETRQTTSKPAHFRHGALPNIEEMRLHVKYYDLCIGSGTRPR